MKDGLCELMECAPEGLGKRAFSYSPRESHSAAMQERFRRKESRVNGTMIIVLLAVTVLVPTALFAAFRATKDTYRYECHYTKEGFSPELEVDRNTSSDFPPRGEERPLSEWPSEL